MNQSLNHYVFKRAAVFAHFDQGDKVDDYVIHYLTQLKMVCNKIVFVSTSQLSKIEISKIKQLCNEVITRKNTGYDFLSWKVGIFSIKNISEYDELIICNDSAYGPLYPLNNIFDIMSKKNNDFWGMTNNLEISDHIQSYFIVFKKNIIKSASFNAFWNAVKVEDIKDDIINKYEVGLTQNLLLAGFKPEVYAKHNTSAGFSFLLRYYKSKTISAMKQSPLAVIRKIRSRKLQQFNYSKPNPAQFYWKELIINKHMPFLKISLLRDNPTNIKEYLNVITHHTDYNLDLITNHLKRAIHKT